MSTNAGEHPRRVFGTALVASLVLSAACGALEQAAPPAGSELSPIDKVMTPLISPTPAPTKAAPLTGTPRYGQTAPMTYKGGHLITNTTKIYYIWYGDWSQDVSDVSLLESFAQTVGGSSYYAMNTTFANSCAQSVQNAVTFAGHTFDTGSQTNNIGGNVPAIVSRAIMTGALPSDPDGVYFVLGAPNVTEGAFCSTYCGYHSYMDVAGARIQYSFVGNARTQCPGGCIANLGTLPNDPGGDGMASVIAHELSETVTDGWIDAWRDTYGDENADKCAWFFGDTYKTASGAVANTHLGSRDFLLQNLWIKGVNGMCANALTTANATCVDGVLDGGESDVDCGGPCPACFLGQRCTTSKDCTDTTCTSGICAKPNCTNGVKDGIESDVDCGELCAGCAAGKACGFDTDCQSHLCRSGVCVAHCANGVKDVDESDVDCGGSCGGCVTGKACGAGTDCATGGCNLTTHVCVEHCANGTKDFGETDVDCGGTCSADCALGKRCTQPSDCVSNQPCLLGRCSDHCTDRRLDGDETDVDCGGSCGLCGVGMKCTSAAGCATHHCIAGSCGCSTAADCPGGAQCTLGLCANRCTDGVKNYNETDVDCGGACPACGQNKTCAVAADCASHACRAGQCGCSTAADCSSGEVCLLGHCYAQCADSRKDGTETDIDCGGGSCATCGQNKACTTAADCTSHACRSGTCGCSTAADCAAGELCMLGHCANHCTDHHQDADETGLDCGGADCAICPICYGP